MESDEDRRPASRQARRPAGSDSEGHGQCCGHVLLRSASGQTLYAAIEAALLGREHGVSVRVSAEILAKLDMLVDAGVCESRSAAATFLMREGAAANADLFAAVEATSREIAELRRRLKARLAERTSQPEGESR